IQLYWIPFILSEEKLTIKRNLINKSMCIARLLLNIINRLDSVLLAMAIYQPRTKVKTALLQLRINLILQMIFFLQLPHNAFGTDKLWDTKNIYIIKTLIQFIKISVFMMLFIWKRL